MVKYIDLLLQKHGKSDWTVKASTDRRQVMKDSDYLVSGIEVSGSECVRLDNDIHVGLGPHVTQTEMIC